jgi:GMP synthase PP-ATPase subunit
MLCLGTIASMMGGVRRQDYVVGLRAVTSTGGMTAGFKRDDHRRYRPFPCGGASHALHAG